MRELEARAFAAGSSAEGLMDKAGFQMARAVVQFCPEPGLAQIFFGKGHNGGDALVAARHLREAGWQLELYPAFAREQWSALTARKYQELGALSNAPGLKCQQRVILDGLLGLGVKGPLKEPVRSAARLINERRAGAQVFAADLPTGLNADTGECDPDTVCADVTLPVGAVKSGLLADSATNYVGRLALIELEELSPEPGNAQVATPGRLMRVLPRRRFDTHKGNYGRIGIVAGSIGLTGAALMCANAAVRSGGGLVTLFVSREIHPILAQAVMPEVMVRPLDDVRVLHRYDVLAIGPGLGSNLSSELLDVMCEFSGPMVIDADAITGANKELFQHCTFPRLLTPHPGEMERLMTTAGLTRTEVVQRFCATYPVALLFKGARTIVGQRGKPISYNTTGSPGMATGGMGDVLTGVCAALLGQKVAVYDAARLGAWLCGRAAELALETESQESLVATDLLRHLGGAFKELQRGCL